MSCPVVVAVAGGRYYADRRTVYRALDAVLAHYGAIFLVHGAAPGADTLAEDWATERGVPSRGMLAEWATYGDEAGPRRNQEVLDYYAPDVLVAFRGGTGTDDMLRRFRAAAEKFRLGGDMVVLIVARGDVAELGRPRLPYLGATL